MTLKSGKTIKARTAQGTTRRFPSAKYDLVIAGRGFYMISACSKRGARFMQKVEGADGNIAYSDQTDLTQDIADGALAEGLKVSVNGAHYLGKGKCAV
jgi:hypothetical protein